ncbi:MAG: hypothetical protein ACRENO_10360 [Thermodesulfobacteriota bacterium]
MKLSIPVAVVRRFDNNGNFIGNFTSGGPELDGPAAIQFGPDGNLYVLTGSDTVLRYNGTTGDFIDVFIPTNSNGLTDAKDMIFGPDGNLYLANNQNPANSIGEGGEVLRFNGSTGAFIGSFISNGAGQAPTTNTDTVCEAMSMAFGPDGLFYLGNDPRDCSGATNYNVMRFNGTTGAYVDTPFAPNSMGLYDPNGMTIGPDGNLYISSEGISFTNEGFGADNPNVIYRLNLTTGAISEFVPSNDLLSDNGPFPAGTGLIEPEKIVFGPDGNLYVTSGDTAEVYRYNGRTGALIGVFVQQGLGADSTDPKGITFFPNLTPAPAINQWGLILMAGFLGVIGFFAIRKRKEIG